VLLAKGEYDKVLAFLSQHEASFGLIIEKNKLVFRILLKRGDILGAINELLSIIKANFLSVKGEF
jgi:hypothetical protein